MSENASSEPQELPRTKEAKKRMIESLKELPIVTAAIKRTGISKATFYRWQKEDPAFLKDSREAYLLGIEFINDMSETQLITLIKEKKMPAIAMWLKHNNPRYRPQYNSAYDRRTQNRPHGIVAMLEHPEEFGREILEIVQKLEQENASESTAD